MDMPPNSPTPDWGTLGPGSDIKLSPEIKAGSWSVALATQTPRPQPGAPASRVVAVMAVTMAIGMFFLVQYTFFNTRRAARDARSSTTTVHPGVQKFDAPTQREAEQLLRRATANDGAATSQIEARAAAWRGHIALTPQLTNLIATGLNASDLRVRAATIQLDLAAMNVAQDAATVDRLARQADSTDHRTRVWAIWTLGLVANRSVERDRITDLLSAHLSDPDVDSRHWAVEALSYVGTNATIPPLLKTMHDDPSPTIRERAACALAQSGMLTNQQRRTTIPTLLVYAEDPSLDAQTHAWTYHALRDITAQHLPDDAAAWRRWYGDNR